MTTTSRLSGDVVLEDEAVLLRPLVASDTDNLLEIALNEPETWKYSLLQAGGSRENLQNYINIALAARERQSEYPFIVFDKVAQKFAGSTRFYDINLGYKTLQLGYTWYAKEFRGTLLNKRCKLLLLTFAFESLAMERVEFRADNRNERSIAAMKSIGCTVEGILRSNMPTAGSDERRDSIVLSILRSEWFSHVKQQLKEKIDGNKA